MNRLLAGVFCVSSAVLVAAAKHRPHIVHIVGDDIGWNDLGYHNPAMITPHIDKLARNGIRMSHFYTPKECAPSRTSMMTGRDPFRYGYYRNPSDDGGVPLNYTMIPEVLKAAGYSTHAIGKWHCGFASKEHTPTYRGFDSFLGYWHWGEEYVDHVFPPWYDQAKCRGIDLTNASEPSGRLQPVMSAGKVRSAQLFVDEAKRVIRSPRAEKEPLYLYMALQNAHDPYEEPPERFLPLFKHQKDIFRRNFSAIVHELDWAIGEVVAELEQAGMWQDTLLWFNADNGGELSHPDLKQCVAGGGSCDTPACCGGAGSNWPLRGGKFTLWEGGLRVVAFAHSPNTQIVPQSRRGSQWNGLAHVSDLFATWSQLAGAKQHPTDGHALWKAIQQGSESPRAEIIHQASNQYSNGTCLAADLANPYVPSCGTSMVQWPYKLLMGFAGDSRHVPLPPHSAAHGVNYTACVHSACLFNIDVDPNENHDIARAMPEKVEALKARLQQLSIPECAPQPADSLTPQPSDEECAVVNKIGAYLPWQ